MGAPKQHHFVPKSYLGLFRDHTRPPDDDVIWMTDLLTGRIVRTQPFSVAKRYHYYSIDTPEGRRTDVEEALALVESDALPVLKKIAGWDFALTLPERAQLALFLSTMMHRVPRMREWIEENYAKVIRKVADILHAEPGALESSYREMKRDGAAPPAYTPEEMREWYAQHRDELTIEVDPAFSLSILVANSGKIAEAIFQLTPSIVVNTTGDGFITCDNPVALRNPRLPRGVFGGPGLMQEHVEVTFPVSPGHCLLLTHNRASPIVHANEDLVWEINSRTQENCERFTFAVTWDGAYKSLIGKMHGEAIRRRPPWEQQKLWPRRLPLAGR